MHEISASMRFSDFTLILEKLIAATTMNKKTEILSQFIASFRKYSSEFQQEHGSTNSNVSFYPILRLLVPSYDIERPADGIKTKTMGKLFVRILSIDPNGEVAKRLTLRTTSSGGSGNRDYADIVYEVMKTRAIPIDTTLTIFDVNQRLDIISACYQSNARAKIEDELMFLLNRMTAIDQKWLIRIMLERIRFGIGPQKIMSMFHPAANDLYARYSHLSKVCDCIERNEITGCGDDKLLADAAVVQPGQPFRPMLCQASHTVNLEQLIANQEFYLETKMDGERFQMHVLGEQYRYFSRKGKEYTQTFGLDVATGTLTPYISRLFKQTISSAIFDGEMMVWNRDERIYHTKAENTDVKSLRTNDSTLRPCFCIYDVLHFNGQCLIRKPYAERVRLLRTLFKEQPGFMVLSQSTRIKDSNHILECLNIAIDNREEGVVIKRADSYYSPGQRNSGWFKIKPDYINGLVTDFDLIVLGGFINVQRTYIKKFLVGVYKKGTEIEETSGGIFYSVATVSSGLSQTEFAKVNGQLRPYWNFCSSISLPSNFECGTFSPDVWIDPKKSIIFEIKASELVQTTSFGTKYTLRFPRIEAIRTDKMWYDCCSVEEYESLSMANTKVQKLPKRHVTSADINCSVSPKRLRRNQSAASSSISCDLTHSEQIVQLDKVCDGLDFCVLGTTKNNRPSIDELKVMIRQHGGNVVIHPSTKTFICIAADGIPTLKVKRLIETKSYNIATVDWLVRALGGDAVKKKLLKFQPQDMICCTEAMNDAFSKRFDAYGDSFTKPITVGDMKVLLDRIQLKDPPPTRNELYEIENELNYPKKADNFYRVATAYFYGVSNDLTLAKLLFKSRGGRCIDCIDYGLSHIMVNSATFSMEMFRKEHPLTDDDIASIKFVNYKWIIDSNRENRKISVKNYLLFKNHI